MTPARPIDLHERYRIAGEASAAAVPLDDEPAREIDRTAGAFFDVDNTVMRGASIFHLARGLAKRRFFTIPEVTDFAWKQVKFLASGAEDMDDMASATESALGFVKGRRVSEIVGLGTEIFDEIMVDKLWPGTLALAQGHLDAGERVWLVTAAPVELATIMAQRLGFTGALGTVSEIVDGVYTGKLVGHPLHGPAKAEAVRALARAAGTSVRYLKPHGALYHRVQDDHEHADAIVSAISGFGTALPVVTMAGGALARCADSAGLRVIREAYADRAVGDDGRLVPRDQPGAVLHDPAAVASQALRLACDPDIDSLCVHGDTPGAVAIAAAVRAALESAGHSVRSAGATA